MKPGGNSMSPLPRTTERPARKCADSPNEIIFSVKALWTSLVAISRGKCCEFPRRATPQGHGRKSMVRSLSDFRWLLFFIVLLSGCVTLEVSREVHSGRNALRLGKAKEAIPHFEAAARMDPTYVTGFTPLNIGIWTYLGRAHYESGLKEKALTSLKRAKDSIADDYFARIYFGLVASQLGNRREGIAELKSGLEGLAVWLQTVPDQIMEGRFWDPGNFLADTISQTRKMLQAEEPNWREITANVEWLGKEFEEEIQAVKEQEGIDRGPGDN